MELCIKRRKRGGTGWLRPDNAGCIFAAWRRILLFSFAVLWFGVMFSPFTATYFLSSKSRQKSSLPLWRLLCKCLQIRLKNGGARTRLRSNRQAAGFFWIPDICFANSGMTSSFFYAGFSAPKGRQYSSREILKESDKITDIRFPVEGTLCAFKAAGHF